MYKVLLELHFQFNHVNDFINAVCDLQDHTLTITVMDWDRFTANDLIGETTIDLENRFISQYRGTCGLPNTFCK